MRHHHKAHPVLARALVLVLMAAMAAVLAVATSPTRAAAADANDFDPAFIISDELFFDRYAMTEVEIQAFLNSKIGTCLNGKCLNVLTVSAPTLNTTRNGSGAVICEPIQGGTMSAAAWIYRVQVSCGISAKVILVTLQKEQGLISGTVARNPSDNALNKAMGAACPDSGAGCDPTYSGFTTQVYRGATLLQAYRVSGHVRVPGRLYNVPYQANAPQCGTKPLVFANWATASLYSYTPYTPNQAALDYLYTAVPVSHPDRACAAYGNRNFWRDYSDWFGNPKTGVPLGLTVTRTGGSDRYAVAVGISQQYYPAGASTVYIATGDNFPDALSAAPAAAKAGGPLLLTPGASLPANVEAELRRLAPTTIVIAGGPASVSDAVFQILQTIAATVTRESGVNRYEVSRNVTRTAFGTSGASIVYLATGATFPDALSASAAAGSLDAPVIMVEGTLPALDAETAALIQELGAQEVRIAGGPASVSQGIEVDLRAIPGVTVVTRLGGADRYVVSGATNRAVFTSASTVFLASGENFPDALSGAAVAGAVGAPLYVIPANCIPKYVADDIVNFGATEVKIFGGSASVTPAVESFTRCR